MIYDYFRVTGAHDTVPDYADPFTIPLRNDDVQEFDTRLDEVLLYKLRIRDSEQLRTVLELYDMEIHQKISMPDN